VERVRLGRRFQGFTDGALGGYAAGLVGRRIDGPAEVNLRGLPPIERELELSEDHGSLELRDGETLVLEAHRARFDLEIPPPPDLRQAEAAAGHLIHDEGTHLYPSCFTCGPDRAEGDGLRLFMGRVPGRDRILASAWNPHRGLAGEGEALPEELLWAALDCPTIWAAWSTERPALFPADSFTVLARQRLEPLAPVPVGETAIVFAWPIERDRRKHRCGAAIQDVRGNLLGRCESLLVEVPRRQGN
jgi:hypothetical protein